MLARSNSRRSLSNSRRSLSISMRSLCIVCRAEVCSVRARVCAFWPSTPKPLISRAVWGALCGYGFWRPNAPRNLD
ncbi:hypothetical protein PLICRDRAFT_530563 [Plicaturopsis crispa FD-325 SS-3]|nr:hypothetical protein PLICRDRAFT_530563 [Plicaturopsis crispa FD-325 SS-3]